MSTDVLIVGAGPVGLVMAAELARYGVSVRIVEKAAQRSEKSKALFLWSRTLELFDRAGASAPFLAAGHKVDAANIVAGNKLMGRVDFASVKTPHPYALTLPQAETERLLETQLADLNVAVERQTELVSFTDTAAGVRAVVIHAERGEEIIEARWLVGCDGGGSTVRKALDLPFSDQMLHGSWVLADVGLTGLQFPDTEMVSFWHPDGFLAVFPMPEGRYRIIANVAADIDVQPAEPTLQDVQTLVDQRGPGGLVVSDAVGLAAFQFHERNVKKYRLGHVFLAGDAAHLHNPAGGQGMNMGIQDAINLAWKLALVCHGAGGDEVLLDSYTVERQAVTEQVLTNVRRLTAASVLKNHALQATRNAFGSLLFGLAPARRAIADTLSEVSLGYEHSPLNGSNDRALAPPLPGERVLPDAGQMPFGGGDKPRFALLAEPGAAVDELLRKHGDLLEPVVRPALSPRCVWLVRPDGYVAVVAVDSDVAIVDDYLDRLEYAK